MRYYTKQKCHGSYFDPLNAIHRKISMVLSYCSCIEQFTYSDEKQIPRTWYW